MLSMNCSVNAQKETDKLRIQNTWKDHERIMKDGEKWWTTMKNRANIAAGTSQARSCASRRFWSSSRAAATSPTFHKSELTTLVRVWWNVLGGPTAKYVQHYLHVPPNFLTRIGLCHYFIIIIISSSSRSSGGLANTCTIPPRPWMIATAAHLRLAAAPRKIQTRAALKSEASGIQRSFFPCGCVFMSLPKDVIHASRSLILYSPDFLAKRGRNKGHKWRHIQDTV